MCVACNVGKCSNKLKSACKLILSVLRFASAKVECDDAIGKLFLNRIFNRTPKQPANPDK